jgi:hypothetical protein
MFRYLKSKKLLFALAVIIIIILNFYTLSIAYPTMDHSLNLGGADLPRDFSVYYIATWRMFHNPSQIFTTSYIADGEPMISPSLTPYKYLPSFLVLISPLVNFDYYPAFWVFDAIQFALLPLMAFLLYKLLENKNPTIALLILVLVLLLPYPMPGRGLSVSYFMSWVEGQAKILLTFLLLVSFYLGYRSRPVLSGVAFAFGAFDPRFTLLALPLILFYNKGKLKAAFVPMVVTLIATNFMIFYPGVAKGFADMILSSGSSTPFYTPSWIPLIMLISLILVNGRRMFETLKLYSEKNIYFRKLKQ